MIPAPPSKHRVPFSGEFDAAEAPTAPDRDADGDEGEDKDELEKQLEKTLEKLFEQQRKLMAQDRHALLVILQGLDACGKDGTVRAITRGLDSAGCRVTAFKAPSQEELDHDFLWRASRALPQRGTIGIFNRSHYEEVLVVRVQPELLEAQRLPDGKPSKELWQGRYESIREFEQHLARNGTAVLKFWLNVSKDEQRRRFLERIEERQSRWKFSAADIAKREQRKDYLRAFSDALSATSRPWAPWYAIPADHKPYMRLAVAKIMLEALDSMDLSWPKPSEEDLAEMKKMKELLERDE